jgi:hypothetical protein
VEQQEIREIMKTVKCFKNMENAKTLGIKRPQGKKTLWCSRPGGKQKSN